MIGRGGHRPFSFQLFAVSLAFAAVAVVLVIVFDLPRFESKMIIIASALLGAGAYHLARRR